MCEIKSKITAYSNYEDFPFNIFGNVSNLKFPPAIAGDKRDALRGGVN